MEQYDRHARSDPLTAPHSGCDALPHADAGRSRQGLESLPEIDEIACASDAFADGSYRCSTGGTKNVLSLFGKGRSWYQ